MLVPADRAMLLRLRLYRAKHKKPSNHSSVPEAEVSFELAQLLSVNERVLRLSLQPVTRPDTAADAPPQRAAPRSCSNGDADDDLEGVTPGRLLVSALCLEASAAQNLSIGIKIDGISARRRSSSQAEAFVIFYRSQLSRTRVAGGSSVVPHEHSTTWPPIVLNDSLLCDGDRFRPISISCFLFDPYAAHQSVGCAWTSVAELELAMINHRALELYTDNAHDVPLLLHVYKMAEVERCAAHDCSPRGWQAFGEGEMPTKMSAHVAMRAGEDCAHESDEVFLHALLPELRDAALVEEAARCIRYISL